ncbi:hypothetical protein ANN_01519 [Periplaneta americana]|uniref:Uncharacterized protein n=1 Tax=Periplaneta americana TaxID=6978 RepID=A0ABQ8TVJ5_PERAM|nr:hypothetical protein ANN_01519 [Periplaneta americana]
MAGLYEGGNEPTGSLKANKYDDINDSDYNEDGVDKIAMVQYHSHDCNADFYDHSGDEHERQDKEHDQDRDEHCHHGDGNNTMETNASIVAMNGDYGHYCDDYNHLETIMIMEKLWLLWRLQPPGDNYGHHDDDDYDYHGDDDHHGHGYGHRGDDYGHHGDDYDHHGHGLPWRRLATTGHHGDDYDHRGDDYGHHGDDYGHHDDYDHHGHD